MQNRGIETSGALTATPFQSGFQCGFSGFSVCLHVLVSGAVSAFRFGMIFSLRFQGQFHPWFEPQGGSKRNSSFGFSAVSYLVAESAAFSPVSEAVSAFRFGTMFSLRFQGRFQGHPRGLWFHTRSHTRFHGHMSGSCWEFNV